MRFSDVFAASLAVPLVSAHGSGIPGAPRIFGMPQHLKARSPWAGHQNVAHAAGPQLMPRQDGRCGTQGGGASCGAGSCCSAEGYCGTTKDHCAAPDCQINYGPGCDANKTPYGATTKNDARPQLGNIEYGGWGIRSCLKPKTVAITYDDGPYIYTEQVMQQFERVGGKATFFVTGNNIGKGSIDENWAGVIQKMVQNGHQVASHTWSHQNLDEITEQQREDQMVKNEMAIRNILGKYPTYMRPPYSACVQQPCMDHMKKLGYVITSFDLDTDDYNQLTKEKIQVAKNNFKKGIDGAKPNGQQLAIAHDIHELTALNLTGYMLEYLYSNGFKAVTVGECMNDPEKNWYRSSTPGTKPSATPSSSSPVPTPTGPTSTDARCGSSTEGKGQSCIGFVGPDGPSECCSAAGWCGRSNDHCGTGCNPLFGKCGPQPSLISSVSVSRTSAAPSPTVSLPTSDDGSCGATAGKTCKGFLIEGVKAECCSEYNYCGNTPDHCGATCNPLYGNCGVSSSSSVSASASKSASSSASVSVSRSASASSKASASASSKASASVSSKASASATPSASVSRSSSAAASSSVSVSKASSSIIRSSSSALAQSSASPSVSKSDIKSGSTTPNPTPSYSASKSDASPASSTPVHSASSSASASISKHDSSSIVESKTPSASAQVSTGVSATPSASASKPGSTPAGQATTSPDVQPTKTPINSASQTASYGNVSPSHASSSSQGEPVPTKVYPSTMATSVKPSSTPCDDDTATPTPSLPVSKDGKCGKNNGGQTCAGYKDPFGNKVECCCLDSGRCSSAKSGCDTKYSNNNNKY